MADETGKINNCIHHDVDILCVTTLDMLIQTVLVMIDKNIPVLVKLVYIMLIKFLFLIITFSELPCSLSNWITATFG